MKGIPFVSRSFSKKYSGNIILTADIQSKLRYQHSVHSQDVVTCMDDNCKVVVKNTHKKYTSLKYPDSKVYDIFGEVNGKVLFIVGRMFNDGNIYIITARWAEGNESAFYYRNSEVMCIEKE
ncbi:MULTISPECIES: hypothetical protein [Bacillus]|uniref:Uncharacterized protein n=1 Tax=Bacillus mycoides TaxID=1405 RepID=A0A3D9VH04_BACMY|nr:MULTISPECIES: hypothetical protein [Bacillus]RBP31499.1 hypothetical protein DET63_101327 [Bacillus sp. DB-2]REF40779.1 hypothetical protein DET55_102151 [Bacillus mycoides]